MKLEKDCYYKISMRDGTLLLIIKILEVDNSTLNKCDMLVLKQSPYIRWDEHSIFSYPINVLFTFDVKQLSESEALAMAL